MKLLFKTILLFFLLSVLSGCEKEEPGFFRKKDKKITTVAVSKNGMEVQKETITYEKTKMSSVKVTLSSDYSTANSIFPSMNYSYSFEYDKNNILNKLSFSVMSISFSPEFELTKNGLFSNIGISSTAISVQAAFEYENNNLVKNTITANAVLLQMSYNAQFIFTYENEKLTKTEIYAVDNESNRLELQGYTRYTYSNQQNVANIPDYSMQEIGGFAMLYGGFIGNMGDYLVESVSVYNKDNTLEETINYTYTLDKDNYVKSYSFEKGGDDFLVSFSYDK